MQILLMQKKQSTPRKINEALTLARKDAADTKSVADADQYVFRGSETKPFSFQT